jgi:hypothetical protein
MANPLGAHEKQRLARQQFPHDDGKGVNVALLIVWLAQEVLG